MTDYYQARVLDVTEVRVGSEASVDHAIGVMTLALYDTQDFSDVGGSVEIEGVIYGYSTKDDDLATIQLTTALTVAVPADTEVYLYPAAIEKQAMIQVDTEDAQEARIPHQLIGVMEALIRDDFEGESVLVTREAGEWEIHDLLAQTYQVYGEYLDLSELPAPVPTNPPAVSPAITVTGTTSALIVEAENIQAGTEIDYHISMVEGFTPDGSTLFTTSQATVVIIDRLPNGSLLLPDTPYHLVTQAHNVVGTAVPSAQVTAQLNLDNVDELIAAKLVVGFVLAGTIQVGQIFIDANEGIYINRPGGGYVLRFPKNGIDPLEMTAQIITDKLDVQNNLSIKGNAQLQGILRMANGITDPTVAPGAGNYWPFITTPITGDNADLFYAGLIEDPADVNNNNFLTAVNFLGDSNIRAIAKDGSLTVDRVPSGTTWVNGFIARGGLCTIGTSIYVMGYDSDRNDDWYIYKLASSNYAKQAEIKIAGSTAFTTTPRIANVNGAVAVIWSPTSKALLMRRFLADLSDRSDGGNDVTLITLMASRFNIGDVHWGSVNGVNKLWVAFISGNNANVVAFHSSTFARENTYDFKLGNGSQCIGMTHDTKAGADQMVTASNIFLLYRYGRYPINKAMKLQQAWFDPDAATGTHETRPGPVREYTLPARSYLNITVNTPPDLDNSDTSNTDRATATVLYISDDGGATWHRSVFTASFGWYAATADLVGVAIGSPKVTNEFASSAVNASPGQFVSTAVDANSKEWIRLSGDGSGRLGPWAWDKLGATLRDSGSERPGTIIYWSAPGIPLDCAQCNGQAVKRPTTDGGNGAPGNAAANDQAGDVAPYKRLWELFGTTHGAGDGSTTFNLPDIRRRTIVGTSDVTQTLTLGQNEGTAIADRLIGHRHGIPNEPTITGVTRASGTATGALTTAAQFNGHNHGGQTDVYTTPFYGMHILIKL